MQFLADRYFSAGVPIKLAVIPEGQELAQLPEGGVGGVTARPSQPPVQGPPDMVGR